MYKFRGIRTIEDLKGKKVLLKLDLNLSLDEDKKVNTDSILRIESILPTMAYLIDRGAKIVIIAFLGRPEGKFVKELRMDPVAELLSKYINKEVKKLDSCLSEDIKNDIDEMSDADVLLLENIRFYKEEKENDDKMAKSLTELFDIYVNDAFSSAHRNHMSSSAIINFLPSYVGFKFQEEIENLDGILKSNCNNRLLILGGAKIKTKLVLIEKLIDKFDNILLGGVMANTFLKARGINIGKSVFEKECLESAKKIDSNKIILPEDALVSDEIALTSKASVKKIKDMNSEDLILDIGPETTKSFLKYINNTELIIWNGPMGYFELNQFKNGTQELIVEMVKSKSKIYTGGGETITMLNEMNMIQDFDFVSTGGGAMLEFLAGNELPTLKALEDNFSKFNKK
jgi:phosphoglycerate kinase